MQALHGAALVARETGMEVAFKDSVFLVVHDSYVGTLSDLEDKFLIEETGYFLRFHLECDDSSSLYEKLVL